MMGRKTIVIVSLAVIVTMVITTLTCAVAYL